MYTVIPSRRNRGMLAPQGGLPLPLPLPLLLLPLPPLVLSCCNRFATSSSALPLLLPPITSINSCASVFTISIALLFILPLPFAPSKFRSMASKNVFKLSNTADSHFTLALLHRSCTRRNRVSGSCTFSASRSLGTFSSSSNREHEKHTHLKILTTSSMKPQWYTGLQSSMWPKCPGQSSIFDPLPA